MIKNLVFTAKVLKILSSDDNSVPESPQGKDENISEHDEVDPDLDENTKKTSLDWLIKRMCKEARLEASLNPKLVTKVQYNT